MHEIGDAVLYKRREYEVISSVFFPTGLHYQISYRSGEPFWVHHDQVKELPKEEETCYAAAGWCGVARHAPKPRLVKNGDVEWNT